MFKPKQSWLQNRMMNSKGTIAIISAVAFSAVFSMMALSFDTGYIYSTQNQLQNAADAGALAAVTTLPVDDDHAREYSKYFANQFRAGDVNVILSDSDIETGSYDFTANQFVAGVTPITAARVKAERSSNVQTGPLPLFFAQMMGIHNIAVNETSVAATDGRVVGIRAHNHLIPYGVNRCIVDAENNQGGQCNPGDGHMDIGNQIDIYIHNASDRGNFGFLNLNGGAMGSAELNDFIINGYDMDFTIPTAGFIAIGGDTGIRGNSLLQAFETVYNNDFSTLPTGTICFMPVFRTWSGNGANAVFEVIDFVAVKINQVQLNGNINSRFIRATIVPNPVVSSGLIVRDGAPVSDTMRKLRLMQ